MDKGCASADGHWKMVKHWKLYARGITETWPAFLTIGDLSFVPVFLRSQSIASPKRPRRPGGQRKDSSEGAAFWPPVEVGL
jgi:hypothetical protein